MSVASYGGTRSAKASAPPVVGMSVVWMLSLSATGMPCSGPRIRPCARCRSSESAMASARGFTVMTAWSLSSYIAMRVRYCDDDVVRRRAVLLERRRACRRCSLRRRRTGPRISDWAVCAPAGIATATTQRARRMGRDIWAGVLFARKVNWPGLGVHLGSSRRRWDYFNADDADWNYNDADRGAKTQKESAGLPFKSASSALNSCSYRRDGRPWAQVQSAGEDPTRASSHADNSTAGGAQTAGPFRWP